LGIAARSSIAALRAEKSAEPASAVPLPSNALPRDTAERRQRTVIFCDPVGSTALSTRLDPEDLRTIINTYHGCCTELVERSGGFVAKSMIS
jgi:class 3 adenylate cyclase